MGLCACVSFVCEAIPLRVCVFVCMGLVCALFQHIMSFNIPGFPISPHHVPPPPPPPSSHPVLSTGLCCPFTRQCNAIKRAAVKHNSATALLETESMRAGVEPSVYT